MCRSVARWLPGLAAAAALSAAIPRPASPASPTTLVVAGSGSNLAIAHRLGEAFERKDPGSRIEVPASIGSTGGIRAAANGAIALGLISRPLRDPEKGLGLTVVPYARTAVVIAAHPTVSDDGVTPAELVQIYQGTRSRWRDGREIVVLTREPGDSSIEALERVVPGFKAVYAESWRARRWTTLYTDQEMNRVLARTPHALGLADVGAITADRLAIKTLAVSGVMPTPENVLSGRYPLVKTLAFVFHQDRLSAGARAFMDFARSSDGEKVLRVNGYLPAE